MSPLRGWARMPSCPSGGHRFEENWSHWLYYVAPTGASTRRLRRTHTPNREQIRTLPSKIVSRQNHRSLSTAGSPRVVCGSILIGRFAAIISLFDVHELGFVVHVVLLGHVGIGRHEIGVVVSRAAVRIESHS